MTHQFSRLLIRRQGNKPAASEVLNAYLTQCKKPPWTSYFVKYTSVYDDQWGQSHFNWPVQETNYHILRTGCYPYIKYHCTKRPYQDLQLEDTFFRFIKIANLGFKLSPHQISLKMVQRFSHENLLP
ncbi:uncharacterized protein C15orf61 isoform X2 [Schistocerca americana]|uniref:uncharacterized protein C15orf61 isoform X2 n=1 Tax=Schistocerca americana TaxID=7009 RepID=UPI001F4FB7A9|nr:uncharacterized protein C15orf61 isoform X2 [Schistocerca americana]